MAQARSAEAAVVRSADGSINLGAAGLHLDTDCCAGETEMGWAPALTAGDIVLDGQAGSAELGPETDGHDYHNAYADTVLTEGRHEWALRYSGTATGATRIGVVDVDRYDFTAHRNVVCYDRKSAFYLAYCAANGLKSFICHYLGGGEQYAKESPVPGGARLRDEVGVAVDFDEDSLQFTLRGEPVGEAQRGIRGVRLLPFACMDHPGEGLTIVSYAATGASSAVAMPVAEEVPPPHHLGAVGSGGGAAAVAVAVAATAAPLPPASGLAGSLAGLAVAAQSVGPATAGSGASEGAAEGSSDSSSSSSDEDQ
jgi:hypothetical protein